MATIITMRAIILAIFYSAFAVCCNCQSNGPGAPSSSWAKLQISPDTLSSMEYGNFLIEIYEHANNHKAATTASQKKYFYSPIALLDHKSAISAYNRVTKQPEMRFRVEMWNDKVQNEVVKHLNKSIGQEIQSDKVRVIPLEKVILTSKIPTADYSLSPVWTNYDKSKTLRLSLSCYEQKVCDELANEMRSDPEQFDHLKLLYSLSSQTSQIKQTTISIDSVTSGQMATTLLQKFGDKKEVFLTASDEKKMLTETATNIRMDTFDDSEVGSPDTEFQIYNILKDLLVTSRTTIKEESDKMWDSVFWNEDNYRPDRTTKTLNEIINKLDTETQKKLADLFQKAEKQSEIIEKLTSSNKDVERRREEQLRRENQTRDANELEIRKSQATDQGEFSRSQTRNDESTTQIVDAGVKLQGFLFGGGFQFATDKSHTHNTEQQNEKMENAKKNSDEQNRNLVNKERIQHNYDSNSWADVDRLSSQISGKIANDSDSSRRVEILKEDITKLLQESRNHIQWDGEKFVPKPMQLGRINLGKFRDSQSFQDRNVRVRYTNAELSAPIKFMEHAQLTVTDEWNNLKDELKDTRGLLLKTSTELTNRLEGKEQELVKTKIEIEKTKAHFRKTVDDLSKKLNATEKELTKVKISAGNLTSELKAISRHLEATKTNLASMRTELNSTKSAVVDLTTKLNARTRKIVDIGQMPTSCLDLQRMGHKLSGFFTVKGSTKIEMIYCNFFPNQNDMQKWIGYADVKSESIYFYVQRDSDFDTKNAPITFDLVRVNLGNAMNLTSGIFTVPRPGTYYFSFTGLATFPASSFSSYLAVRLYLNGGKIGTGYVEEANTVDNQRSPLTLQSTLNLEKGDQVWVGISSSGVAGLYESPNGVKLLDNIGHYTHFTGFLLEEEIIASL